MTIHIYIGAEIAARQYSSIGAAFRAILLEAPRQCWCFQFISGEKCNATLVGQDVSLRPTKPRTQHRRKQQEHKTETHQVALGRIVISQHPLPRVAECGTHTELK